MSNHFFWLDIFCLDQFSADKMKTIVRGNEICEWASKYYGMGLVIFDRVWCLAETGCTGANARRQKKMVMEVSPPYTHTCQIDMLPTSPALI